MRFFLDTTDSGISALLNYTQGNRNLVEYAMHRALEKNKDGELVTIKQIKAEIDALVKGKAA